MLHSEADRKPSVHWKLAVFLSLAFGFRVLFGLCSEFWMEDERQIYLIGLKYYATGLWPYFGPDVVYTRTQIPGALQGLLVGVPLKIAPVPEAPIILLNLISLGSLSLLAWYIGKRAPGVPAWFTWAWIFTCPWTLDFSTNVTNPSYVLTGGILFFVAMFELLPPLSKGIIPSRIAFVIAGFALLWVFQLHMSYPLLLPYAGLAFYYAGRRGWRHAAGSMGWFLAGMLTCGSVLMPTLLKYGLAQTAAMTTANVQPIQIRLERAPVVAARFLSFASFELARFIGPDTPERVRFFTHHWWVVPFAAFAGLCGILQVLVLAAALVRRSADDEGWRSVRLVAVATMLLVFLSFAFSVRGPASHAFYVVMPVAMIYSFHVWERFFRVGRWRMCAMALLVCGLAFHIAVASSKYPERSLYGNRGLVQRAISEKNYRLLGERRSAAWGCCY